MLYTEPDFHKPIRVVIPAYHAGQSLQKCINRLTLELKDYKNAEIFIISYKSKCIIEQKEKTRVVTLSKPLNAGEARNLGAENCGEKILVFTDADVLVEPESIKKLIDPIMQGKADATVGNYAKDIAENNFFQNYKKIYIHEAYAQAGYIENEFWTGFSAIKGNVFWEVKGFSEKFKLKGGEDTEFGIRLTQNRKKIFAVADACGKHLKEYNFTSLIKNDFDKGTRTVLLALKQKVKLTQNRHAKKKDQYAVFFALAIVLALLMSILKTRTIISLPFFITMYFLCRNNFFAECFKYGWWFFIRSFCMAIVLDIVRACALLNGILLYAYMKYFKHEALEHPIITQSSH